MQITPPNSVTHADKFTALSLMPLCCLSLISVAEDADSNSDLHVSY